MALYPQDNPFTLHGKRVLVTGASGGIGRAIAIECTRAGATVIASGRDATRLAQTQDAFEAGEHVTIAADLGDPQAMQALVRQAGQLDGVVHAAGVRGLSPIRMMRQSHLQEVLDNNLIMPSMLTQKLLYEKSLRNGASILFLSSIATHTGTVGVGPYSASKAGLEGLMRCLALEIAPRAMRANALAPGLVDTALTNVDPGWLDAQAKMYPLGIGKPEDVAYAAIFMLADASRKITGTAFHLDGGIPWT
jgi:NAD(P)-dependent dehydrogenase (short-subunit alcohol dehydrogenase family)